MKLTCTNLQKLLNTFLPINHEKDKGLHDRE